MPVLVAQTRDLAGGQAIPPPGYAVRPCDPGDAAGLAHLYFAAYPPGVACATPEEAQADIAASFLGEYGEFCFRASPVVIRQGALVAAVMTVRRANWEEAPDCPYLIEVFTAPAHRRRGLARAALKAAAIALGAAGETRAALTVADDNAPALALYRTLGFVEAEAHDRGSGTPA